MSAILAASPLVVILVGMVVLRQSAFIAGLAGLALAGLIALTVFAPAGPVADLAIGTGAEALHTTATILWIILPALAIYEFQNRTGAINHIRDTLSGIASERRIQAILIAWFFGLFMEGAAGFGTPVALATPLLVGLGYPPVRAVVLALLGHAAGVSFGAVGTPALAQIAISGLPANTIAFQTMALHTVTGPMLLLFMVRLAADTPLTRRDIAWTILAAISFFVPALVLAALAGPELATLGAALAGTAVFVAVWRWRNAGPAPNLAGLPRDLAPYGVVLALVLVTRLVPPLKEFLGTPVWSWQIDGGFTGSFQPLYHPGTILILGFLLGALMTRQGAVIWTALTAALRRLLPVAVALLVMLTLSRLMVHSGMIQVLALTAAQTGAIWPFLAPFIGILGTFITGSATASNILFTELQLSTADTLGLSPSAMAAVQGFGAAVGNIVAPHNIIAGSATVGLVGKEGDVLARTAIPCLIAAGIGGTLVLILA
ncbi:L-lactate permease [Pseudaestuariivita rosea]|uniref:L-lactate permease n=1 Tax=Pseudaestuariivita rosea TaxID=2763263 RepID=UPI001ABA20FF|nr:L-lactate permease [Pseudaestuariivita rosea]